MKKWIKILLVCTTILILALAFPTMRGTAQSFWNNYSTDNIEKDLPLDNPSEQTEDEIQEIPKVEEGENNTIAKEEPDDIKEDKEQNKEVEPVENLVKPDNSKKVFLTFDDGPTKLTPEILRILKEKDVLATFFTIGKNVEKNPQMVKQIYDEGHMVLPHSYTHDYSVYTTFESYYKDLEGAKKAIEDVLQIEIPYIFRFPGGSSNQTSFKYGGKQFMPELTEDVKEKGYYYIDWNVSSGDASPDYDKKEQMLLNVINGSQKKDYNVVLFHDTTRNTLMAEVLPEIIDYYKAKGYSFESFRDISQDELNIMVKHKIANKPIIR